MPGRRKLLVRAVAALAAVTAASAPVAAAQGRSAARPPRIRARPANLMIDTGTTLRGAGFPASSTIDLRECGRTFWLVPEHPCNAGNEISVTTNAKGRFTVAFRVELCPEGAPGKVITERTCYIGEPVAEEDTVTLQAAVKLIVTYP